MFEQSIAIATQEFELMLAARFIHSHIVLDRMRFRDLRQELVEEMRLGPCPIQGFVAGKSYFLTQEPLRAKQEFHNSLVGPAKAGVSRFNFLSGRICHGYRPPRFSH